jgi:hypothetical protein
MTVTAKVKRPGGRKAHLRAWWQPVLNATFDDPRQEAPFWDGPNNVVLKTPFPGIRIKGYAKVDNSKMGVFISAPKGKLNSMRKFLKRDAQPCSKNCRMAPRSNGVMPVP